MIEKTITWHKYPDEKPTHMGSYYLPVNDENRDQYPTAFWTGQMWSVSNVAWWADPAECHPYEPDPGGCPFGHKLIVERKKLNGGGDLATPYFVSCLSTEDCFTGPKRSTVDEAVAAWRRGKEMWK